MSKRVRKSRRVVEKEVEGVPVEPRPSSVVEGEEAEASDRELPSDVGDEPAREQDMVPMEEEESVAPEEDSGAEEVSSALSVEGRVDTEELVLSGSSSEETPKDENEKALAVWEENSRKRRKREVKRLVAQRKQEFIEECARKEKEASKRSWSEESCDWGSSRQNESPYESERGRRRSRERSRPRDRSGSRNRRGRSHRGRGDRSRSREYKRSRHSVDSDREKSRRYSKSERESDSVIAAMQRQIEQLSALIGTQQQGEWSAREPPPLQRGPSGLGGDSSSSSSTLLVTSNDVPLLSSLSEEAVESYIEKSRQYSLKSGGRQVDRSLISARTAAMLDFLRDDVNGKAGDWRDPEVLSAEDFFSFLRKIVKDQGHVEVVEPFQRIREWARKSRTLQSMKDVRMWGGDLKLLLEKESGQGTIEENKAWIEEFKRSLRIDLPYDDQARRKRFFTEKVQPVFENLPADKRTLLGYVSAVHKAVASIRDSWELVKPFDIFVTRHWAREAADSLSETDTRGRKGSDQRDGKRNRSRSPPKNSQRASNDVARKGRKSREKFQEPDWPRVADSERCNVCGRLEVWHRGKKPCPLTQAKGANNDPKVKWRDSAVAKDILARTGYHTLPTGGWSITQSGSYGRNSKGESCELDADVMAIMALKSLSSLPFIEVMVCNEQGEERMCKALLDTGASANFISKDVVQWLIESDSVPIPVIKNIAGGLKSAFALCRRGVPFDVKILSEAKEPPGLQALG